MRRRERGTTTVEFAVVGAVFFVVLFGLIEFGRAYFVWNSLNEATRRGARVAVVCPVNHGAIAQVALFGAPGTRAGSVISDLNTGHIQLRYLSATGAVLSNPAGAYNDIRFVSVAIAGYQHQLLIPFFMQSLTAPAFETVLPRESLGVTAESAGATCFGQPS